jgi:hypothetical protein
MTRREQIVQAIQQTKDLESLLEGLEYTEYLTLKTNKIYWELQRQLKNIDAHQDDLVFDR